jgi:hypothetical protein
MDTSEDYSISDAGLTANTYFEVSLENRSLDLRDGMADEGFVITGKINQISKMLITANY